MRKGPISIVDIARIAHVSHSTVSRALQNSPLVNGETAERIKRIARESGYVASAVARSLATRSTRTVGVVVPSIADPFVGEVVTGIEGVANERGYTVILANSHADPQREIQVARSFGERRVDGILVTASRVGAAYGELLASMNVPVVLINNQSPGDFAHSIMIDNVKASRKIMAHLIGLGHRRIAYIGDRTGFQSDKERLSAFCQSLKKAGLPLSPQWIQQGDGKTDEAERIAAQLLQAPNPPTAIFCYNDMSALGALRAAHSLKRRVPRDLSLVGFDDLFVASYTTPPLTTVRQPKQEMGRKAMEILLELLAGGKPHSHLKVQGELIVRGSTAAPRGLKPAAG